MKFGIEKEQRLELEHERDRRLMKVVAYAMNDGLKTFPANHAKGLHKVVAEYGEICALLDGTHEIFHPSLDNYQEP